VLSHLIIGKRNIYFILFAEDQIQAAEDARTEDDAIAAKSCLEVREMDVYSVKNKYYFICSEKDVFLLNDNDEYSKKLSESEIKELDFSIVWIGNKVTTEFESNDERAILALVKIIDDFSTMVKKEEFHGFALASIVSHLRGFLYEHILRVQLCFYTSITMSGEQRGTGK
jgi:hypothetical protein